MLVFYLPQKRLNQQKKFYTGLLNNALANHKKTPSYYKNIYI